ncbi:hypothetical protein ILUMI_22722 [Ignelater luminosus]|uniref:Uncharacterized protein n=1 Tax=Ignelater luminosus TaxID=2038154 RepID=A0A8K0FXA3_IGNLU|nr:hypothetical protein ILUMI_22722 [Ignelater luminosus]
MHILVVSLCVITISLIVLNATPCPMEEAKEKLIQICGLERKRRYTDDPFKPLHRFDLSKKHRKTADETRHHGEYHIIHNDTHTVLIRHKRGMHMKYLFCCMESGNCSFIC